MYKIRNYAITAYRLQQSIYSASEHIKLLMTRFTNVVNK